MTDLLAPISIPVPKTDRIIHWTSLEDVRLWAEAEQEFWRPLEVGVLNSGNLQQAWSVQQQFASNVLHLVTAFQALPGERQTPSAQQELQQSLQNNAQVIQEGRRLVLDNPLAPRLVELWRISPEAAVVAAVSTWPESGAYLGNFGNNIPVGMLGPVFAARTDKVSPEWLEATRAQLQGLANELERARDRHRSQLDTYAQEGGHARDDWKAFAAERSEEFAEQKARFESDFDALKRVYDEKLALAAPATYWDTRRKSHLTQSIVFGAVFGILLAVGLWGFFYYGWPHLKDKTGDTTTSVVLTLVPVIVPAFGAVWLLKVMARLLSESLSLMRDAGERVTMVKTFLALIHDEERSRTLLTEQDRILVLHALFRPSSIASSDDSPPVHWFDVLASKIGDKK